MKMKPSDYDNLCKAIQPLMRVYSFDKWARAGMSGERYRWDLLHASGYLKERGRILYGYLTDDTIDTALRKITNTK